MANRISGSRALYVVNWLLTINALSYLSQCIYLKILLIIVLVKYNNKQHHIWNMNIVKN